MFPRLLRAHRFSSYEQANTAWEDWNEQIARKRVHGTHGEVVAIRALRDHAALLGLPTVPYLVVERTKRIVARDGLFSFEGRRYAIPDARPGERVELLLGAQEIEAYSLGDGRRLARHRRGAPAKITPDPSGRSVPLAAVLGALPRSQRSVLGRSRATRRLWMGELITERIARNAKELKLLGLAETADELVDRAEQAKLGYREFLDLVLESELGVVEGRRYTSRLKLSGSPHHKTLEELDTAFQRELDPKRAWPSSGPCASSSVTSPH